MVWWIWRLHQVPGVDVRFGLVYWGLTPQQQPGAYQGDEMMMMKSVFWWRKPKYPEETTDLRQVTDETFHTYGLCPVRGLNLGRSGVKQSELRRDESGALAHRATVVPFKCPSTRSVLAPNGDEIGSGVWHGSVCALWMKAASVSSGRQR